MHGCMAADLLQLMEVMKKLNHGLECQTDAYFRPSCGKIYKQKTFSMRRPWPKMRSHTRFSSWAPEHLAIWLQGIIGLQCGLLIEMINLRHISDHAITPFVDHGCAYKIVGQTPRFPA